MLTSSSQGKALAFPDWPAAAYHSGSSEASDDLGVQEIGPSLASHSFPEWGLLTFPSSFRFQLEFETSGKVPFNILFHL